MKIVSPSATLTKITHAAEEHIEKCGRVAWKSEAKMSGINDGSFLRRLIKMEHLSVLEHASATIHFVCDRAIANILVRHRIASYTQESQQFCNYTLDRFGREITFIEPPEFVDDIPAREAWYQAILTCENAYFQLRERGFKPRDARSVLPNCTKTELISTLNFRAWREVFEKRLEPVCHPHTRWLMAQALRQLKARCPNVFHDIEPESGLLGVDTWTNWNKKG